MKTTIKIMFATAVVMLSACQQEDLSTSSNFPADGVIRVATNVEAPATRAGMTTENIKLFMLKIDNAANTSYSYYGRCELYESGWLVSEGLSGLLLTMLWQNSTQHVTVTALSIFERPLPEKDFTGNCEYALASDQSREIDFMTSDILYMAPKEVDPAKDLTTDGKLPITFKHIMSKLNLTITLGTELNTLFDTTTNPITDLGVNGTIPSFFWNASINDAFNFQNFGVRVITPWHNAAAYTPGNGTTTQAVANYEVILVPQTVAANDFSVKFQIGGRDYLWTSGTAITLESGKLYSLNLTAGKDIVNLGGFTASEWGAGTGGDLETE